MLVCMQARTLRNPVLLANPLFAVSGPALLCVFPSLLMALVLRSLSLCQTAVLSCKLSGPNLCALPAEAHFFWGSVMYGYLLYDTAFTLAFYSAVGSPSAPLPKHGLHLLHLTFLLNLRC